MSARRRYNFAEKFAAIRSDLAEIQRTLNEGVTILSALNVKIRKLHPVVVIPQYATAGAAGFDLIAMEDVVIAPGETKKVPLGLAFEIPAGYVMYVCMRSGIALKTKLRQPNGIGVIDSDYRGEVAMMFDNTHEKDTFVARNLDRGWLEVIASNGTTYDISGADTGIKGNLHGTYVIRKGDRVAQAVIAPFVSAAFVEADALDETERGAGGFGHTGV